MAEKYKDARYRNAKSEGKKITKLYDGNGLFLWVYEDGRKYWRLRYSIHGKEKSISLGVYPDVSLSEAREKAKLERKKIEDHIDPSVDRKIIKQRAKQAAENSFETVAREWYTKQLHTWVHSHAKDVIRRLEGNVFPYIGMHPISNNTLLFALYRLGHKGKMTGHGFRAVASTILNESGFNPDAIERQLAHCARNEIRGAIHAGKNQDDAMHEALISFEIWQKIQERLKGNAREPARKNLNQDFPLRGFVTCASCNEAMTSCWSTGRNKRYAYYLCQTRDCANYGKSVRKEKIEEEFESLLRDLRPSQDLFYMALDMFRDLWNDRLSKRKLNASFMGQEVQKLELSIAKLLDRIVETDSPNIIVAYENRIRELESRKTELNEKIRKCGTALPDFDETFRTAFSFLSNSHKIWCSDRLEDKRTVLKLAFAEKLPYCRNKGFRTARYALPFALLEGWGKATVKW